MTAAEILRLSCTEMHSLFRKVGPKREIGLRRRNNALEAAKPSKFWFALKRLNARVYDGIA